MLLNFSNQGKNCYVIPEKNYRQTTEEVAEFQCGEVHVARWPDTSQLCMYTKTDK